MAWLFIHLSADRQLSYFYMLAIMINAAIKFRYIFLVGPMLLFLLGRYLGAELPLLVFVNNISLEHVCCYIVYGCILATMAVLSSCNRVIATDSDKIWNIYILLGLLEEKWEDCNWVCNRIGQNLKHIHTTCPFRGKMGKPLLSRLKMKKL